MAIVPLRALPKEEEFQVHCWGLGMICYKKDLKHCDTKTTVALMFKKVIHQHMGSGMIALVMLNAAQCLAIIGLLDLSWPSEVEATAAQCAAQNGFNVFQ